MFKTNFKIGNSNIIKSKLGFGCWGVGGGTDVEPAYGITSPKKAIKIIESALMRNINFFDICSGVESSPGHKDIQKLKSIVNLVKS